MNSLPIVGRRFRQADLPFDPAVPAAARNVRIVSRLLQRPACINRPQRGPLRLAVAIHVHAYLRERRNPSKGSSDIRLRDLSAGMSGAPYSIGRPPVTGISAPVM
jgi:hypothetical protein